MSSATRHRGRHPGDDLLFSPEEVPAMRQAVADLGWLLGRGYARASALKLVGDRHELRERQRLAVGRAACADAARESRLQRQLAPEHLAGRAVVVDGFNLLVSLEAALGSGVLLLCSDGCIRDMASVHGSYHAVAETDEALRIVGTRLAELGVASAHWLLDKPVSNSGRLAQRMRELAAQRGWRWSVETVFNPDTELIAAGGSVVISSDAVVIEGASGWFNLAADLVLNGRCGTASVVDLREQGGLLQDGLRHRLAGHAHETAFSTKG